MASWTINHISSNVLLLGIPLLPAMVEGFDRELVPHLAAYVSHAVGSERPARAPELALVGDALASIPTDDAMAVLAQWKNEKHRVACQSYPERARRMG